MSKKGPKKNDVGYRTHWAHSDVLNLVNKVGESWPDFCSGIRKKKFIWREIADELEQDGFKVSGQECDRKWRNLKIRYLAVLEKQLHGDKTAHRIDYFEAIHSFLKNDPIVLNHLDQRNLKQNIKFLDELDDDADDLPHIPDDRADNLSVATLSEWSDKSVQLLLDLLLEFKDWFTDKDNSWDDTTIWETISEQMKIEGHQPSPDQCREKWCSLSQEFHENKAEAEASGSVPLWQFYTRVRYVVGQVGAPPPSPVKTKITTTPKQKSSPTKPKAKRGRPRKYLQSSDVKANSIPVCKREVPDIDIGAEEMSEDVSDPLEQELPKEQEPSSRTTNSASRTTVREVIEPADIREVCQRLENIEDNMAITRRLDTLEAQLDLAAEQRRAQQQTNTLLSQVLSELSALRRTLGNQSTPKMGGQDPTDLASGITIVVPHSQQL